jgi:hydroxymethylpyrimidine/phosphomethylpyrimidine kinase
LNKIISKKINKLSGTVLIIAGSDPSGGAGIQADLKTVTSLGAYGMTAITALTVQNTLGVTNIFDIPVKIVQEQIDSCLLDIEVDSIKIGMMHNSDLISAISESLNRNNVINNNKIKIILDPVMVAKGGHKLLKNEAIKALKIFITKCNPILTPNIPEAEILTGMKIKNLCDMEKAAKKILTMGASHVLLKGGHLDGDVVIDILVGEDYCYSKKSLKIKTNHTHGTGCTMSSVLATSLAQILDIKEAFEKAHDYVQIAIKSAPCLGHGNGPINHCHSINFD